MHQMKLSRLNINMRDILFNSFKFVVREKSMRERVLIKNMVFIYGNIINTSTSKIMNKFLPINNTLLLYLAYENQGSQWLLYLWYLYYYPQQKHKSTQHSSVLIIIYNTVMANKQIFNTHLFCKNNILNHQRILTLCMYIKYSELDL